MLSEGCWSVDACRRWLLHPAAALAAALAATPAAEAQRVTADLSGTVVDAVGGVLPGADVTLVHQASGSKRQSVTNGDGVFVFSAVPAATYTAVVTLPGFTTYEYTDIVLRGGDSRTLRRIRLKVAALAETVSVSAETELAPLDSGEKSVTLDAEVIDDIPIVGSSAAELLRLLPGMTPLTNGTSNRPNFTGEVMGINAAGEYQGGGANNQSALGNYSANGTWASSLDITVDGAPGADPGCNCSTPVNPNTEFVQEFKVLSSSFSAEYAKGPSSVTVVTKSGGTDFHGSAFLYFRDYRLNSNDWFANRIGDDRVKNSFLYPGFTLSGPLSFGSFNEDRSKLFFFVGFEYYRQRLDTGYIRSWVPTDAMKAGDFSDPGAVGSGGFVNAPLNPGFPGGIVPPGMQDPGGRVLLNAFPAPNAEPGQTGGWNYVDNLLVDQPNRQLLARVDWNISDRTKVFVRYNHQRETQPFVIGLWWRNGQRQVPYPSEVTGANQSDSITTNLTHVFDPTLTSETSFAFTYIDFQNGFADRAAVSRSDLGYPYQGVFGESNDQIPSVDAGGWGDNGPMYFNPGGFDPDLFATKWQYAFTQNLTKVWGTHTTKLGFFWERIRNKEPGRGNSNGNMVFGNWSGTHTGNTFADLLTGNITASYDEQTMNVLWDISWDRWEAFAQDSWKVSPGFTLNYGARFSYLEPWTDNRGTGFATWHPDRYEADVAAGRDAPGVYWNAIDPSVPLSLGDASWSVQPRVGFAWDVTGTGETVLRGGGGLYLWHDTAGGVGDLLNLPNGVRSYFNGAGNVTIADLEGLGGGDLAGGGLALDEGDTGQPRTYTWSLTLNQRLPWSMNVELGYAGNRQDDQVNGGIANINAVPLGAMSGCFPGCQNNDDFRPLGAYQDFHAFRHWVYTHYHGLQALLARQRGSFNFTLAYTFSKTTGIRWGGRGPVLGSDTILSPYRDFGYGVPPDDRTHVATGSFSWLLPQPDAEGAKGQILGGWQIAGIVSYVSGPPLPYVSSVNFDLQGTNELGQGIDSRAYSGTPDVPVMPVVTCDPREDVPEGYMFNPACFALPTPGTNGNYNLPYMKGQPFWNVDLSVFKNFDLDGGKKLQLRVSAYNVLNHSLAFPDVGTNLTMRFDNGVLTDPSFGRLPTEDSEIGAANKAGRRIIQLAVRFTF